MVQLAADSNVKQPLCQIVYKFFESYVNFLLTCERLLDRSICLAAASVLWHHFSSYPFNSQLDVYSNKLLAAIVSFVIKTKTALSCTKQRDYGDT